MAKKKRAKRITDVPGPTGISPRQRIFLTALIACSGNQTKAAKAAKVDRKTVWMWRNIESKTREKFCEAFKTAMAALGDALESEAWRRAVDGTTKQVTYRGQPVFVWVKDDKVVERGTAGAVRQPLVETSYSDQILIALLKANKPKKYRDRSENLLTGPKGGPIRVSLEALRQELLGRPDIHEQQRSETNA